MHHHRLHLALAGSLILAAACAPVSTPPVPDTPASIEGRVTAVTRSGERIGTIRVEERPADASGSAKASVRVTQSTTVVRGAETVDFNALQVGQWVRVWFTGPVAESYPVQATGSAVAIDSVSAP
jgi:hypothetical protein